MSGYSAGPALGGAHWYDDEAGPLVRLYALTGGRARPPNQVFDLMTLVVATGPTGDDPSLSPEQAAVLELCARGPRSVAEIAAECELPLGIARVLLGDLLAIGHIRVRLPLPQTYVFDQAILQEVIDGLRAL
ncbi:MAG TPA: DUF742 domain-containing protein [Thermoleophilia bacterium]|jgi:hypothetical protein|nr:DUF742 domain-containing protein [Thermoleophilia bacterium]